MTISISRSASGDWKKKKRHPCKHSKQSASPAEDYLLSLSSITESAKVWYGYLSLLNVGYRGWDGLGHRPTGLAVSGNVMVVVVIIGQVTPSQLKMGVATRVREGLLSSLQ